MCQESDSEEDKGMGKSTNFRNENGLVNGRIPANTECPFKIGCDPQCHHKGKEHNVPFSCGLARAQSLIKSCVTPLQGFRDSGEDKGQALENDND